MRRAIKVNSTGVDEQPESGAPRPLDASAGFSYVEAIVTVVIVGVTVIAALVGLRTTVISSDVGTERSELMLWAQSGAEALHRAAHPQCSPQTDFQTTLDAVAAPEGAAGGSLVVATPRYLSIDPMTFTERWASVCDPAVEITSLLISATSAKGTEIDLEVVLDG